MYNQVDQTFNFDIIYRKNSIQRSYELLSCTDSATDGSNACFINEITTVPQVGWAEKFKMNMPMCSTALRISQNYVIIGCSSYNNGKGRVQMFSKNNSTELLLLLDF